MPYPTKNHQKLFQAILQLKTKKKATKFFRDLLTIKEINSASERWQIVQLLWTTNLFYRQIAQKTRSSSTTVTRVAHWLNQGQNGYRLILARLLGPQK